MKSIRKSNLFTTTVVMLLVFSFIGFLGCEKQEFYKETDLIMQSDEYQEYLVSYIVMSEQLQQFKNTSLKTIGKELGPWEEIEKNNGYTLYKYKNSFDTEVYKNTIEARKKLLSKHPEYINISAEEKIGMANDCFRKSKKIEHLLLANNIKMKTQNVRLKSSPPENKTYADWQVASFDDNNGQFNATAFKNYEAAVDSIRNFSVEGAIWLLPDGSAILISDSQATTTSMTVPYRSGITSISHLHPNGNPTPSSNDSTAFRDWRSEGINTAIIITNDSIYVFDLKNW